MLNQEQLEIIGRLSDREYQVFLKLGEAWRNEEIANNIPGWKVSVKTIETHIAHLKQKLECDSIWKLRRFAVMFNLMQQTTPVERISKPRARYTFSKIEVCRP